MMNKAKRSRRGTDRFDRVVSGRSYPRLHEGGDWNALNRLYE